MTLAQAMVVVLALFFLGDLVSTLTGAKVSSVFVALFGFLILFMAGIIPADIMTTAGLKDAAKIVGSGVVFHMGTNINLKQLAKEWRTVVLAILSMFVAIISVCCVIPIIGKDAAVVTIPIVNGGIMATNIMVEEAISKGAAMAAALGTLAYAIQKFVGTIPASRSGLKEAHRIVDDLRAKKAEDPNYSWYAEQEKLNAPKDGKPIKVPFYKKVDKIWTSYTCLFVVYVANLICIYLASLSQGYITSSIWALILGATCTQFGLVPPRILERGKCIGAFMLFIYVSIISSLATISFADLVSLGGTLVIVFAAVLIGTYIFLYVLPGWKVVGSKNLAVGIAMAQLLGYPATYLVTQEIAKTVGETQEEQDAITARIEPAYVIAGFATVTSLSIFVAGIFVNFI